MSEYTDAVAALSRADSLENTAWRRSGWYLNFLLLYGAAQLLTVPALVLLPHPVGVLVSVGLHTVVVLGLSVYTARQRTVRPGFGRRHAAVLAGWAVAFALTAWLGSTVLHGSVAFAVAASSACVLPLAAGAWCEIRRAA
jgi:hypothetical protein